MSLELKFFYKLKSNPMYTEFLATLDEGNDYEYEDG